MLASVCSFSFSFLPMLRLSVFVLLLLFSAVVLWPAPVAAQSIPTVGNSCVTGLSTFWEQPAICVGSVWQRPAFQFGSTSTACASGTAGMVKWNGTNLQVCDGAAWNSLVVTQTTPTPTAPSGSGYFVLTASTYDGNRGGLTGADSACLTELTTNTNWNGYSTANSNGQLTSGKVRSFLCGSSICNNLMPSTTYYFAKVGDSNAGGASFTTDSNGQGPQDSFNWSSANAFSGTYNYWSSRGTGSATLWSATQNSISCSNWTSSSAAGGSANQANTANSSSTTSIRWNAVTATNCNNTFPIICFVNP